MRVRIHWLGAALIILATACGQKRAPVTAPSEPAVPSTTRTRAPARIILFIGDGMGVGQLTAATYMGGKRLNMVDMPHLGFMTTHETEFLTTDSAASATAVSTGHKTTFEAVSVKPGTTQAQEEDPAQHMQTMLGLASQHGLRTGLVSTCRVNHATPAAFAGHRFHRHQYDQIATDIAASDLDVVIGPGLRYFTERDDGHDLLSDMRGKGWATASSVAELDALDPATDRVIALLDEKDYPFLNSGKPRALSLPDMVSRSIELLDRGQPDGWVLVVEGSFVDWCAHNLDGACAAVETLDLDDAVGRARDYASARSDTLIVATADHETAGVSVIDPYYANRFSKLLGGEDAAAAMVRRTNARDGEAADPPPFQHFAIGSRSHDLHRDPLPGRADLFGMTEAVDGRATAVVGHFSMASRPLFDKQSRFYGAHTPTMVTIHAEGPGAKQVTAVRDSADLGRALRALIAAHGKQVLDSLATTEDSRPRNVVLMVGDGMGLSAITAAHYITDGVSFVNFPATALLSTHATDYLVNDSAATATALATGERTRKRAVGKVVRDGQLLPADTVLMVAERAGLATGIVTTTPMTHATPAAFYAHQDTRYDKAAIAADLVSLPPRAGRPEVLLGGGSGQFPEGVLEAAGYEVHRAWPLAAATDQESVVGLLADDGLAAASVRLHDNDPKTPTLAELTQYALNRLGDHDEGFFLLVEGGQIDWRMHEGKRDISVIDEISDFDGAVKTVTQWASERGDTLIIVTADHDHTFTIFDNHYAFESGRCGVASQCGGPMQLQGFPVAARNVPHTDGLRAPGEALRGGWDAPLVYLQYAWPVQEAMMRAEAANAVRDGAPQDEKAKKPLRAPHAANFVPLFATGPWSDRLRTLRDQPEVGVLLKEWAITGRLQ